MNTNQLLREHLDTFPYSELSLADTIEQIKKRLELEDVSDEYDYLMSWETMTEEKFVWMRLSRRKSVSVEFIRVYEDQVSWFTLFMFHPFAHTYEFKKEFKHRIKDNISDKMLTYEDRVWISRCN